MTERGVVQGERPSAAGRRALYEVMLMSREADRREAILVRQGVARFTVSGAGHEAIAALAGLLTPEDWLFPHYRDRALVLARGVTLEELALDALARDGSSSAGRNMPVHWSSRPLNIFSVASPVGSQCLPAAGAAWALQRAGVGRLALCCLGDGSTRQGEFYEALCLACQEQLPLVFVVEANRYAISTSTEGATPLDFGLLPSELCRLVDGGDVDAVADAGREAFARARGGHGPTILWCHLERLESHSSADDQRQYRSADELAAAAANDPLERLAQRLLATAELTATELAEMRAAAERRVALAYEVAAAAATPDPRRLLPDVLAPLRRVPAPPALDPPPVFLAEAVNGVLDAALAERPEVLLFGEDIEDPRGGVFGLTRGLSRRWPGRVRNSALAEATIVGAGVGFAAAGLRPIVELQFIDFIGPALNQLASQVATLRWRTAGSWNCPLILYAPSGGYVCGGLWHSQTNEGWWAHLPGLRVVVAAYPDDAVGLFWTALAADDPTLILLPKQRLRLRLPSSPATPVPFGRARCRRIGRDATIVTWGNGVGLAEQAAETLSAEGLEAEVLDLRSLVPCDWAAVRDSLARTGRLVVVDEDSHTCSFGMHVIAEMTSREELLALHLAAPRRVGRGDLPVPFGESLEPSVLPSAADVADAVRAMME